MKTQTQYSKLQKIGEGAYGAVYKAINQLNDQIVALKVSKFQDCDEGIPSTCIRQVAIIKNLDHPNLVKLLDAKFYIEQNPRLEMVFEFVDFDLGKFIKCFPETGKKGLSQLHTKKMIKSILSGIHYLHSRGIIHRDLKPHNILVTKQGQIKIADYGLGRICTHPLQQMSKQIQTLWYRAPQLLLGTNNYDWGVDTWSVGCIFYQIMEGVALFKAECQIGQLFEIFKILGTPKRAQWPQIVNMPCFSGSLPKFKPNPPIFNKMSFAGQQFLWKLLRPNPQARITIADALKDKYLQN